MLKNATANGWGYKRSADLYQVDRWGKGFFSVEPNGHLHVCPTRNEAGKVDLMQILEEVTRRGCGAPVLVRFPQIAQHRLQDIQSAFATAIRDCSFAGKYTCVYPIKVNQHRDVVDAFLQQAKAQPGEPGVGLEAGSKAELLAIIPSAIPGMPILCNGFKDVSYIEMALRARQLGLDVHIIIEKPSEFRLAVEVGRRLGIDPKLGVRVKLAARGSGHWEATGGHKSKFGLTVTELLTGIQQLRQWGMDHCVKLLHFHLGSQIPNIRRLKAAVIEATRIYADLVGDGVPLETIDVGGGLGVDYSGMQNNSSSSMNYSLQEYANDVIYYIHSVCQQANVETPNVFSESGRALVAHHSVLVFPVFGSTSYQPGCDLPNWREMPLNSSVQPLVDLMHALNDLTEGTLLESYHDAQASLETAINLFNSGYLSLSDRAMAETLYREVCRKVSQLMLELEYIPHELESLQVQLADIFYGNFSLFRSLPDHWAIGQLFPVMPLHRLNRRPSQKAILSDITCDSDGKLNRFISTKSECSTLPLHPYDGSPYYIGVFLAGAYQEILGCDHNLLGDTHVAHVIVNDDGSFELDLETGQRLSDVLEDVGHETRSMVPAIDAMVARAAENQLIDASAQESYKRFFARAFQSYCYLDLEAPMSEETVRGESKGKLNVSSSESDSEVSAELLASS